MYESPITIVRQKLHKAISEQHDDYIMATASTCAILNVFYAELLLKESDKK